jgi:hypothetical protein
MAKQLEEAGRGLEPPKPPEIKRLLKFYRLQAIGVPLIALIPLLALFKVFDTTRGHASAEGPGLGLEVSYPAKLRYRTFEPIEVRVQNRSSAEQNFSIELDAKFMRQFQNVQFEPDADEITDDKLSFKFDKVKPGESRTVEANLEADDLGTHACIAGAELEDGSHVEVTFNTFVFP